MCKITIKIECEENMSTSPSYLLEIQVNPASPSVIISLNGAALELPPTVNELPAETVGEEMTELDFVASGGTAPYTFSGITGTLPDGVQGEQTDDETLAITGTPLDEGTFDFGFSVTDSSGAVAQVSSKVKVAAAATKKAVIPNPKMTPPAKPAPRKMIMPGLPVSR